MIPFSFLFQSEIDLESPATTLKCNHMRLEWYDLRVVKTIHSGRFYKRTTEDKVIIDGVSGIAEPGELLAIMGPSGGGKTSLLNALSRRLRLDSGKILLNDKKLPK